MYFTKLMVSARNQLLENVNKRVHLHIKCLNYRIYRKETGLWESENPCYLRLLLSGPFVGLRTVAETAEFVFGITGDVNSLLHVKPRAVFQLY